MFFNIIRLTSLSDVHMSTETVKSSVTNFLLMQDVMMSDKLIKMSTFLDLTQWVTESSLVESSTAFLDTLGLFM